MEKRKKIPELLLPAGNVECFYAAIEGGADAIYLGTKQFNARERAANFSSSQLKAMVDIAHKRNSKIYITLNTVIKNEEIPELLNVLHQLDQIKPDALIIQDIGIWYLLKQHFHNITMHASTQMGNHNSVGAIYAKQIGMARTIMARELTLSELTSISKKNTAEIEIFAHGALCYSFSGMCLFSSYLGGMGANRGLCKQACRRIYHGKESGFLFSLKDSQLIDFIPDFSQLGISSIKIEGRLKPAEYVYRVAKAYRMALDDNSRIDEAKEILELDLGREKTQYFMGGNVSDSITQAPATGKNLGLVVSTNHDSFVIESDIPLIRKSRLRVFSSRKSEHSTFKIEDAESNNGLCRVFKKDHPAKTGDIVFLAGIPEKSFPSKIQSKLGGVQSVMPQQNKNKILRNINIKQKPITNTELIIRINELAWLPKVDLRNINYLILNLSLKEWKNFNPDSGLIKKFQNKIIIELPKFIPEDKISIYKNLCKTLFSNGIKKFSLSHMSQKLIVPEKAWLMANENVYTFNDFSILGIKSEGIRDYIRPLESDYPNLLKGKDRFGIIPIFFHPHLFISRMPVKTGNTFREEIDGVYMHHVIDGITYVIPEIPVSLTQYINKLYNKGFKRYLVDLSFTKVSSNRIKTISKKIKNSEQIQPSTNFNFKLEMK